MPYRLAFAQQTYGVTPIDFDPGRGSGASTSSTQTNGRGVDATIEAVGFEAKGSALETALTTLKVEGSSGMAMRQCIAATRRGGTVSMPGVYAGFIHGFLFGDAFDKGLTFKMGQTHVQKHMPELLGVHPRGEARSRTSIISHRMALAEAAEAYKIFDESRGQLPQGRVAAALMLKGRIFTRRPHCRDVAE